MCTRRRSASRASSRSAAPRSIAAAASPPARALRDPIPTTRSGRRRVPDRGSSPRRFLADDLPYPRRHRLRDSNLLALLLALPRERAPRLPARPAPWGAPWSRSRTKGAPRAPARARELGADAVVGEHLRELVDCEAKGKAGGGGDEGGTTDGAGADRGRGGRQGESRGGWTGGRGAGKTLGGRVRARARATAKGWGARTVRTLAHASAARFARCAYCAFGPAAMIAPPAPRRAAARGGSAIGAPATREPVSSLEHAGALNIKKQRL